MSFATGRPLPDPPPHFLTDEQKWSLLDACPRQLVPLLRAHIGYGRTGLVWVGRPALAKAAGIPSRTFDRHRTRLVELGYLVQVVVGRRGSRPVYRVRTPGQRAAWLNASRIVDPGLRREALDELDQVDRLPLEDGWS
jgi:hypothetical protein